MAAENQGKEHQSGRFAIVLHGGAGNPAKMTDQERAQVEAVMKKALAAGRDTLAEGGTALDAVERAIRIMEDDPVLNAGRGAIFNAAGGHELDSSIMDGSNLACGAVAGVRTVKNPISLARRVMNDTPHVLFTADGAEALARKFKLEMVEPSYFSTDSQRKKWEEAKQRAAEREKSRQQPADTGDEHKGTVGCVALDSHGNLAAGTSTGGTTNKLVGRIGDSPVVGAGTYADNATCGVSCTGTGEEFIRHGVAKDISARMAYLGETVQQAAAHVVGKTLRKNDGGVIALAHDGTIAIEFNTPGMTWAAADSGGRFEVGLGRE